MKVTSRITLLLALFLAGCANRPATEEAAWSPVSVAELNALQRAQLELAMAAKDEMMSTLMATLSAELATGGAAGAIAVCKDRAPQVAAEVGASQGVAIGRTSFKLRNPRSTGPAWAAPLLEDRPTEPRFTADQSGSLGVTLPILLQAKCLGCHGEKESMPAEIRAALTELYPEDRATGFAEGDLRGWFWVEVPALLN